LRRVKMCSSRGRDKLHPGRVRSPIAGLRRFRCKSLIFHRKWLKVVLQASGFPPLAEKMGVFRPIYRLQVDDFPPLTKILPVFFADGTRAQNLPRDLFLARGVQGEPIRKAKFKIRNVERRIGDESRNFPHRLVF
jgi:hypothetical protein